MNRAIRLPQYSDMKAFAPPPDGIQLVRIDRASNLPADDSCPSDTFQAAFLAGTVPQSTCSHMGMDVQTLGNQLYGPDVGGGGGAIPVPAPAQPPRPMQPGGSPLSQGQPSQDGTDAAGEAKHRNVFKKMFGIGKEPKEPASDDPNPH